MKKLILLLALIFISRVSFGQNFPGDRVELLLNKEIKVVERTENLQEYGYDNFYLNDKMEKKFALDDDGYNSKYNSLVGKIFKVLSAEQYTNLIGAVLYKLKIENPEIGILFYKYDPRYEVQFLFEVMGGLDLPTDFYCKDIKTTTDKFNGSTTSSSDYSDGISFIEVTKDNSSTIYMSVSQGGITINVGEKGLILLLENGKRIERPEAEIDVKVNTVTSGYIYSAFISLSEEEINLIIENPLTDKRLYIYDGVVESGERLSEYLRCLTK
jgi:hypothetical protein